MNDLLLYIDQVDQSVADAEINVLESLIASYDKSIMIIQESADNADLSAFEIFQEGEKWDKFKEDSKAPVLGNKGEGIIKRMLMIIPRLIQKVIQLIRKTHLKITNKRLLKNIEYIETSVVNGRFKTNMKIKGTLDKKSLAKLLKAMKSDDFMKQAKKAGKLKEVGETTTESYVSEAHKFRDDHDPIRNVGNLGLKHDSDMTEDTNRERLISLIGKYNEERLLSFFYDTIQNEEIRSKYNYRDFLEYLKRYLHALKKIDERKWNEGDVDDRHLDQFTELLKGIKTSSNIDSGNVGQWNPFIDSQYKILIPLQEYKKLMNDINRELKDISNLMAHFKTSSKFHDAAKHPNIDVDTRSHAMHAFLDELTNTFKALSRYQTDFIKEIDEMSELVDFTKIFMNVIENVMELNYRYDII